MTRDFDQDIEKDAAASLENSNSRLPFGQAAYLGYPRHTPLHVIIRQKALEFADKVAVQCGETSLTYRQLNERANQLAHYLIAYGVVPGDKVGLSVERSCDMMVAVLGILKTGAAYVPIDLEYPKERVEFMLQDSGSSVLLTSAHYKGYLETTAREISMDDFQEVLPGLPFSDPDVDIPSSELAYVLYTSGSTGRPKGVMVEHRNLVNLLCSLQILPGMQAHDKMLAFTTIAFDISTAELFLPLISGAQVLMVGTDVGRDGRMILETVRREKITFMQATPSTWKMMLEAGWEDRLDATIISCGEALSRHLADKLAVRCRALYNMYGPTETTVYSTVMPIFADGKMITIGRPIFNTRIYILDGNGTPLGEGAIGEICISGDGVARGYLHRDDLTAERFVDDPFAPGSKMYRSGDYGKWVADGSIQFSGRDDQQVKVRGHRIELGEVEHHFGNMEGIKEAVVILREDRSDDQRLVAYIVPEDLSAPPDRRSDQIGKWKQALRKILPFYMVPATFVYIYQLPLTANGKLDRKALPKPGPDQVPGKEGRFPKTDMQILVAGVWCEVLGMVDISIDDDFFELGGHSLIAVQMMVELERKTGKRLPMASLFEAPTVEQLSRLLESGAGAIPDKCLVPIKPQGTFDPLYIVHGIGLTVMIFKSLARYMHPEQPVYGLQAKGLDDKEKPFHKMEEIAAHYISEILVQNPHGPYYLAGYSMGGIIAFEMARQLKAMGKEVKLLVLIDTYADDGNPDDSFLDKLALKIRRQPPKLLFIWQSFRQYPVDTVAYQWHLLRKKGKQVLRLVNPPKQQSPMLDEDSYSRTTKEALRYARKYYHVRPDYEGKIDLFRVKTRLYYVYDPAYLGWGAYASKGLRVWDMPGDHKTLLESPHDQELAECIQKMMDERRERNA